MSVPLTLSFSDEDAMVRLERLRMSSCSCGMCLVFSPHEAGLMFHRCRVLHPYLSVEGLSMWDLPFRARSCDRRDRFYVRISPTRNYGLVGVPRRLSVHHPGLRVGSSSCAPERSNGGHRTSRHRMRSRGDAAATINVDFAPGAVAHLPSSHVGSPRVPT